MTIKILQQSKNKRAGFASLPVVLLLGGVIIELAITSAFIFYYVNSNVYGNRLASQAAAAARSAIDEAVMRVILNPNCGNDINCPSPYTLTTGAATAEVTITKNLDNTTSIVAVGKAQAKQHRIVSLLSVSSTAPLISIQTITDAPQ